MAAVKQANLQIVIAIKQMNFLLIKQEHAVHILKQFKNNVLPFISSALDHVHRCCFCKHEHHDFHCKHFLLCLVHFLCLDHDAKAKRGLLVEQQHIA